jgi:hypothetical protein
MLQLTLYGDYGREAVHDLFEPAIRYTPQAGKWGILGIVPVRDQPGDFVFFVTYGQSQGDHEFDEWITTEGVLSWQSQPKQRLAHPQITQLIAHDELRNTIYLFLRTAAGRAYTYLGRLKYVRHDNDREQPVYFHWQILEGAPPSEVTERIALSLVPPARALAGSLGKATLEALESPPTGPGLQPDEPPSASVPGLPTAVFRARTTADYSAVDARNRKLGMAGEQLVLGFEKERLSSIRRKDLAEKVEHIAKKLGDGVGYDIGSFDQDGTPLCIEVKTTRGDKNTPFFLTSNELAYAKQHAEQYALYRVFQCDPAVPSGQFFILRGDPEEHVSLAPTQYRARVVGPS